MTSDRRDDRGRPDDSGDADFRSGAGFFGHSASHEARLEAARDRLRRRRRITLTALALALAATGITTIAVAWPDGHDAGHTGVAHASASLPTTAAPGTGLDPAADRKSVG